MEINGLSCYGLAHFSLDVDFVPRLSPGFGLRVMKSGGVNPVRNQASIRMLWFTCLNEFITGREVSSNGEGASHLDMNLSMV